MANEFDDKNLDNALHTWRESAEKQAERPDWFWARQRALLSSKMQEPRVKRVPSLAWAGIAATVAIGVALMVPGQKPTNKSPVPTTAVPQQQAQVSDSDLMQQLQETMNSSVPDALQPASSLKQELDQAYRSQSNDRVKENMQ